MSMIPTQDEISALEQAALVTVRPHNTLPLRIVNYTPKAQYEQVWTPALLQCRGLVYDHDWNLVARPLPKFFNYQEHGPGTVAGPLPTGPYTIMEKYDGSLGIVFRWKEHLLLATRGSFHSEQAERGRRMLEAISPVLRDCIVPGETHLVEIIYPQNRIVVSYGEEERLQYLTTIITATGVELPYAMSGILGFSPEKFPSGTPIADLLAMERPNAEGFVLRYANGQRVKIKHAEYVRLHALVTGLSTVSIWEHLRQGGTMQTMLGQLPDELMAWARQQETALREARMDVCCRAADALTRVKEQAGPEAGRKELAFQVLKEPEELRPLLFMLLDDNMERYEERTWKMVRPAYSKPITAESC